MSSLLVNLTPTSSQASTDSLVDITALAQSSVAVGSASSIILMMATVPLALTSGDDVIQFRFAVDDTPEGPFVTYFNDDADDGCGGSICWATTTTAANHKFALQMQSVASKHGALDSGRNCSLYVVEITDATLLVNKASSADTTFTSSFSDIAGLTDTQTVTAGSVLLLLGNVNQNGSSSEYNMGLRFTIGGAFEGPELTCFDDTTDEFCSNSMVWAKDGISGATDFALQANEIHGTVTFDANDGYLQVIEITANVQLHTNTVNQDAHTVTGAYVAIPNMTSTFTPQDTNSIILLAAGVPGIQAGDHGMAVQFADGGTNEGPEAYIFGDSSTGPDACGHSIYYAVTGKTGSKTFTLEAINVVGTQAMDTTRNRSFVAVELKAAAVVTVEHWDSRKVLSAMP